MSMCAALCTTNTDLVTKFTRMLRVMFQIKGLHTVIIANENAFYITDNILILLSQCQMTKYSFVLWYF